MVLDIDFRNFWSRVFYVLKTDNGRLNIIISVACRDSQKWLKIYNARNVINGVVFLVIMVITDNMLECIIFQPMSNY